MAALHERLVLNQAPSQADRMRATPSPDGVEVDGRSFSTLLAFAGHYGNLITFYDLTDNPDGDWSAFFQRDQSIALALRASLDLESLRADFDRLLADLLNSDSVEAQIVQAERAVTAIHRLASMQTLGGSDGTTFDHALAGLGTCERRDLLAEPVQRLRLLLGGNRVEQLVRQGRDDWLTRFAEHVDAIVGALLTVFDQDRAKTLAALDASMDDNSHPPQSGLYDAFAVLFKHAQASINRFPERLIQFYQRDILHQTDCSGTPDSVCLTFTPAKDESRVELHQGTRFLAGVDSDGESIAYALDNAISVDIASVAALNTLTVTSVAIDGHDSPIPAQVLSGTVALSDKIPAITAPFPIFGATETGSSGVLTTIAASLGFAIASPTLLLAGGTRSVTVGFSLTEASLAETWLICEHIGKAAGGVAPEDVFVKLIEAAFTLRYSTAGGWVAVEGGYQATPIAPDNGYFVLSFVLEHDADPFVALSVTPPEKNAIPPDGVVPDRDVPLLWAMLRQDAVVVSPNLADPTCGISVYPYALLSGMMMSALSIDVEVTGLAQFETTTPSGPVDTSHAFQIFGSPPVQGATLDITSPELFAKRMTHFDLTIDWFGLPVTTTGFEGYYKAYVVDADGRTVPPGSQYDNQSFLVELNVFNPGWWDISNDTSPNYLFRTADYDPIPEPDKPLRAHTQFIAHVDPETPEDYYDPALSAVRLTLTKPDTAFGSILYAPNVMAASVQLTAAASACAQQCGQDTGGTAPQRQLDPLLAATTNASDGNLDQALKAAVQQTVANLDGAALQAIDEMIAASDAMPETKQALRESLAAALGARPQTGIKMLRKPWQMLRKLWTPRHDAAHVHANLAAWFASNSGAMPVPLPAQHARAHALIDAATDVLAVHARASGRPAAVARPMVSGVLRDVTLRLADALGSNTGDCIQRCMAGVNLLGFPNQPWLPTASGITINYGATAKLPVPTPHGATVPEPAAAYFQLLPFDGVAPISWTSGAVPLLAPIDQLGALFVTLSDPADMMSLLFRFAPPEGGWPTTTPPVSWAVSDGTNGWTELIPLRDKTNNFHNSGIVSLSLANTDANARSPPVLRISTTADPQIFPDLAGLASNAATASWVGPGGSAALGIPLRAGTITKPESPLPEIGSVDQPLPSTGGAPAWSGPAFGLWLAERLRHKDRAIQDWDYSNLVLAAFPSLWQVAVVPASGGGAKRMPGCVQVIPIPGPSSPAVSDPTIPSSDSTLLEDIQEFLGTRISAFIDLAVNNPVYRRLKVVADLIFTDEDTLEANKERLNGELILYLSPWPSAVIGPRHHDYYTLNEVAHFIRNRPYVRAILSLQLVPEEQNEPTCWHYLTSATSHTIKGKTQSESEQLFSRGRRLAGGTRA